MPRDPKYLDGEAGTDNSVNKDLRLVITNRRTNTPKVR